jgi:hypothetical protein
MTKQPIKQKRERCQKPTFKNAYYTFIYKKRQINNTIDNLAR